MKLLFNLFTLKKQLEINMQREYTWRDIARRTDVHYNTLHNIASNKTQRVDTAIIARLLVFFTDEGMPVTVGDLFTVEDGG